MSGPPTRPPWADHRTGLCSVPEPGPGPWPLAHLVARARARVHVPATTVAGAGTTDDQAAAACLGEALERYAAGTPRPADARASTDHLRHRGVPHVAPGDLGLPVPGDVTLEWLRARDGRLVPRDAAGAPAHRDQAAAGPPYPQGSTGLASATTVETAEEGAAAEVVERDTLVRAWYDDRLAPVRPEALLGRDTVDAARAAGLEVRAHLLPTGAAGSEVAVVALRAPATGLLGVGAAYRPDRAAAASKAWQEAVVSVAQAAELIDPDRGPGLCAAAGLPPWRADRGYAAGGWQHVSDLLEHALLLLDPRVAVPVWGRLDGPPQPLPGPAAGRPARTLLRALFSDTVSVDLTPADVALLGRRVVRVLAMGAQTMPPAGHRPQELPCPLT